MFSARAMMFDMCFIVSEVSVKIERRQVTAALHECPLKQRNV